MIRTATSVWEIHSVRLSANSPQKELEYNNQPTKKESFRRGVEAFWFVSRPQVGAKAQNV